MWPLVLLAVALASAALWYRGYRSGKPDKYKLGSLTLIFAGAALMFLLDSAFTYIEEGTFVEYSLDALKLSALLVAAGVGMWSLLVVAGRLLARAS